MKKYIGLTVFLMSVLFLISCAKKYMEFVELPKEQWLQSSDGSRVGSIVYVYRPNSMANIMVSPQLSVDEKASVKIKNNSYQYILLPYIKNQGLDSKKYFFAIDIADRYTGAHKLSVKIKSGDVVYIRLKTSLKFENKKDFNRSFNLEEMNRETALNEIKKTQYAGVVNKPTDKSDDSNESATESNLNNEGEEHYSISKTRNPFNK